MSADIFYFSGTGNSLKVAQMVGEKLNGRLIPLVNMGKTLRPKGTAGIVVPVYHQDIPHVVKTMLDNIDLSCIDYLFAFVTMGNNAGNALYSLSNLCKNKGKALDYGIEVKLADNSIAIVTKPLLIEERFERLERLTVQAALAIKNRELNTQELHDKLIWKLYGGLTKFYLDHVCKIGKKIVLDEQCSRCGLCVKVCPVNNIRIKDNNVEWGDKCADCFACIHWCPQKAISFGNLKLREKEQYHAPGITINEMVMQSKR